MNNQELIIEAINNRKPISFAIEKENHTPGERVGNTHAIYYHTLKNGDEKIYVDIWRTSGVVTDLNDPLPKWKKYIVEDLKKINVLNSETSFEPAPGYNPNSENYNRVIAKI
jgi:hypothetical protein